VVKRKLRMRVLPTVVFLTLGFALLLVASGCGSGSKTPPVVPVQGLPPPPAANTTAVTSYARDVQVIFNTTCVVCHQGQGAGQSGLSLEPRVSYGNLVGVPSTENPKEMRVKAGVPDQSYIIAKLSGTQVAAGGSGAQMPYQATQLSQTQIDLISQWISQGALNN
jgi:mono/diheme cytochrome c family protein